MIDPELYSLIIDAIRTLFLGALPMLAVIAVIGLLGSALQAAMAIRDGASLYALRVLALIGALALFIPMMSSSLMALARLAFR